MADTFLIPESLFSSVYKIETSDWIDASTQLGVSNKQAQALLNRLQWIYDKYNTLIQNIADNISDPINTIKLWYKDLSELPAGWQICDGTNGTPNLRDIYIRGAENDTDKGSGGGEVSFSVSKTLTASTSHSHSATCSSDGSHMHYTSSKASTNEAMIDNVCGGSYGSFSARNHLHTGKYTTYGGDHKHNVSVVGDGIHTHNLILSNIPNLPASVAIYYVMKIS